MKMRTFPKIPATAVLLLLAIAAVAEPINIRMSREDRFRLQPPQGAQLKLEKYMPNRIAVAEITGPQQQYQMQLTFLASLASEGVLNDADKLENALRVRAREFLPQCVEQLFRVYPANPAGRPAALLYLTDRKYAEKLPPAGEWRYLTCGMVRIGDNAVLTYLLKTNSIGTPEYARLLKFVDSFVKPAASAPAGAKISDSRAAVQALIRATPEAAAYLPFTATLNGSHWQLDGSRLDNTAPQNDTRHYQVETATGKVSELK